MHIHRPPSSDRDLRTPLLFVGNNRYGWARGTIGRRAALDEGVLSVFAVAARSRLGLSWFVLRALLGRGDPERDCALFGEWPAFLVRSRAHSIDVALDGEVRRLRPPLRFSVMPKAVRLRVPAPPA